MKKITNEAFEAIWESVAGMQPAEAPNYIYSKIRNRIVLQPTVRVSTVRLKPIFILGMLILSMLINLWMLQQQKTSRTATTSGFSITDFAAEYGLNESYPN